MATIRDMPRRKLIFGCPVSSTNGRTLACEKGDWLRPKRIRKKTWYFACYHPYTNELAIVVSSRSVLKNKPRVEIRGDALSASREFPTYINNHTGVKHKYAALIVSMEEIFGGEKTPYKTKSKIKSPVFI